ncbi:MAG: Fe-S cluster assembly transcriptional regulator IscR [Porticoccaceae bacterium]
MKLTTRGRYAVTAMLDLALHSRGGPISLADISARQEISLSYLEQLFAKLRQRELVSSVRGPGGGYYLSRAGEEINIAEIISAVNETTDATNCGGKGVCQNGEICLTHHLWEDLSQQIHQFLSGITLAQLMDQRDVKVVRVRQDQRQREYPDGTQLIASAVTVG